MTTIDPTETWRQNFRDLCAKLLGAGTGALDIDMLCDLRADVDADWTLAWFAAQGAAGLVVETGEGRVYPAFQFTDQGELSPELAPQVATLRDAGLSPWLTWMWLTEPAALLSGSVPAEILISDPRRGQRAVHKFAARLRDEGCGA